MAKFHVIGSVLDKTKTSKRHVTTKETLDNIVLIYEQAWKCLISWLLNVKCQEVRSVWQQIC